MTRFAFLAGILAASLALAGDKAVRLFDREVEQAQLPEGGTAVAKACLAAARTELLQAFNDHRSDQVLVGEAQWRISRCLHGDAAYAAEVRPARVAQAEIAEEEAPGSTPAPAPVETPVEEPPAQGTALSQQLEQYARELNQKDAALGREFLSWYLCQVCQPIVDGGVALRKANKRSADKAALAEAERQISAGKACGKFAVGEFKKSKARPLSCKARPLAAVAQCLAEESPSNNARCRALQLRKAESPAASSYLSE